MSPQAAVAVVRQVFQQQVDEWNAPDVNTVLAILVDDAVQMPPDTVAGRVGTTDWRCSFWGCRVWIAFGSPATTRRSKSKG
jgi:ketosteroid isomerase-like protein